MSASMRSVDELVEMKGKEPISVLTCYDYTFAKLIDGHVDMILVGDSLGNVVLGHDTTRKVTLDDMIRHTESVARGAENTFIIADLSYRTYEEPSIAICNAKKLMKAGAHAVKPEGKPEIVEALTKEGIPVVGHVGLLPQTAEKLCVQGKDREQALEIVKLSKTIEKAGAFSLIIECVPNDLGKCITDAVKIPTVGIGAGPDVDGQVLVLYDMLGMYEDFKPKFVKKFDCIGSKIQNAVKDYSKEVKAKSFPEDKHCF